jgi:hypothetical protein
MRLPDGWLPSLLPDSGASVADREVLSAPAGFGPAGLLLPLPGELEDELLPDPAGMSSVLDRPDGTVGAPAGPAVLSPEAAAPSTASGPRTGWLGSALLPEDPVAEDELSRLPPDAPLLPDAPAAPCQLVAPPVVLRSPAPLVAPLLPDRSDGLDAADGVDVPELPDVLEEPDVPVSRSVLEARPASVGAAPGWVGSDGAPGETALAPAAAPGASAPSLAAPCVAVPLEPVEPLSGRVEPLVAARLAASICAWASACRSCSSRRRSMNCRFCSASRAWFWRWSFMSGESVEGPDRSAANAAPARPTVATAESRRVL